MTEVRAARLTAHGHPLRVEAVELSPTAPGEVEVEMAFGGVNPIDRYVAEGRVAPEGPLPRTIGLEGSGRAGGRSVLVRGHGLGTTRDGLWASRAVVPEAALVDIPEGVALDTAAAMGIAGVTAWRAVVEKARVTAEDRVLVLGASGGVGSVAVSVARGIGARVWGQTGTTEHADWVGQQGAERAVVADAASLAEAVAELAPTVVVDPLGDGFTAAAIEALAPLGRLVIFGTSAGATGELPLQALYRKGLTLYGYGGLIESDEVLAGHVADALAALGDGRLAVAVDRAVPLAEVNDALAALADRRVLGKLVLDLGA